MAAARPPWEAGRARPRRAVMAVMERIQEASPFMSQARLAFEYSLSNFIWKQAVFFAERMVAEGPGDETSYLLALAYFHNQETGRAYWRLQNCRLPEARYLLARCCFQLQKWDEAEDALLLGSPTSPGVLADVANGAAGLFLLGQVKEKQAKRDQAIECYAKCLELCPFMWDAYERWSWLILGSPSPSRSSSSSMAAATFSDEKLGQSFASMPKPGGGGSANAASTTAPQPASAAPGLQQRLPSSAPASGWTGGGSGAAGRSQNAPPRNEREPQHHSIRKERRTEPLRISGAGHGGNSNSIAASAREAPLASPTGQWQGALGRSPPSRGATAVGSFTPLRSGSPTGASAQAQAPGAAAVVVSPSRAKDAAGIKRQTDNASVTATETNGEMSLAGLLCKLGTALHAMHNFESAQTIRHLSTLPRRHYDSGYVLDLVGLCHFEAADYKKAELAFQQVWRIEPRRVEGLEYYSTVLWHLRKDIELGHLAQRSLQWDRLKPQVWCVVGNCFSLQNEHDVAIKFFKRAIQVDPSFTYAYTLCGHEFVANEKFDKAIPMYEQAISVDSRHYNAWWGLGNIYHRQEEHENARYHFLKALEINKSNSVLRCYLGMVLESLNNPTVALENFDRASQGEPQNGMAYFNKACVLMNLERYEEALADLKKVRCLAPKEACVHFQLGKVYMKLQRDRKALLHFNIAMDLNRDSKDYHTIKTHIERLHIRGVKEPEGPGEGRRSQGRLRSTSSSSTIGEERERVDGRVATERAPEQSTAAPGGVFGAGAGGAAAPSGGASPQQPHASAAGNQRPGSFMSQHYGSPSSRAEPSVPVGAPSTPSAARGYAAPVGRSLWSSRGGSSSASGAFPHAGGRGSGGGGGSSGGGGGGSPSSWGGGTPGGGSASMQGGAAATGFRI